MNRAGIITFPGDIIAGNVLILAMIAGTFFLRASTRQYIPTGGAFVVHHAQIILDGTIATIAASGTTADPGLLIMVMLARAARMIIILVRIAAGYLSSRMLD